MDKQLYVGDYKLIGDVKLQFMKASYFYYTVFNNNKFAGEVCFKYDGGVISVDKFYSIDDELLTILILKYGNPHPSARAELELELECKPWVDYIVDWR